MCGVIALVFIVTTAAEVALIAVVGKAIGALATFGIIIATGCIGAFLAKRAGVRALEKLRQSVRSGGTSAALVEGALVLAAGVTLLSPGFITDAIGLSLLVSPVRAVVARWILSRIRRSGSFANVMPIVPFAVGDEDHRPEGVPPDVIDV